MTPPARDVQSALDAIDYMPPEHVALIRRTLDRTPVPPKLDVGPHAPIEVLIAWVLWQTCDRFLESAFAASD